MKIKTKLITFITFPFLLMGCNEDFLDKQPLGVVSDESLFATENGPLEALYGTYNQLQYDEFQGTGIWALGSCASDDAEVGGEFGGHDYEDAQQINEMTHHSVNTVCSDWWKTHYMGAFRASTIITNLPEADYVISEEEKDLYIAEAKFLRAFFYFQLAKVFGGVPTSEAPFQPDEIVGLERKSLNEVYTFIEQDLLDAAQVLPDVNATGRVDKGAANALLAKLYLFESSYAKNYPGDIRFEGMTQKWDKVKQHAEMVMNSSANYKLLGLNGETYESNYSPQTNALMYLFTCSGNNSEEAIFEVQNTYVASENVWSARNELGFGENFYGQGTRFCVFNQCRNYIDDEGVLQANAHGWGFNTPTSDFMDEMNAHFADDPRVDYWIAQPGDSLLISSGGGTWVQYEFSQSPTGYHHQKADYVHPEIRGSEWWQQPYNVRLIRLADVILWAAEAEFEMGNNAQARNYLNMIRQRARNSGTTGQPEELTGQVTLLDIVRERRIELCFESHRFYDLVRWRLADEEISGYDTFYGGVVEFEEGTHEFFPLPSIEIDKSGGSLEQNPGY